MNKAPSGVFFLYLILLYTVMVRHWSANAIRGAGVVVGSSLLLNGSKIVVKTDTTQCIY